MMTRTGWHRLILFFLFLLTMAPFHDVLAQGPECCDRHAVINSCQSDDPMHIVGSQDAYCRSIRSRLSELMTRDCFHILYPAAVDSFRENAQSEGWGNLVKQSNIPEHEYSFDTEFVSGLNETNDEGRPVRSRLSVKMYFEGEQREFVYRWNTQGTWDTVSSSGTDWSGHGNKLRHNYKKGPDIIEIMERFEKRPVDVQIKPDKSNVNAGEVVEFNLTDFHDVFGQPSREFNRIIVHAFEGDILNGEACKIGPDYKVFKVNAGTVKVKYRAPSDCGVSSDRITLYSSCDILPNDKISMEETEIKERLIEKKINIQCYDATIKIIKRYNKTLNSTHPDDSDSDSCKTHREEDHAINEAVEATVDLSLKLETRQDMPIFNQTWEYYKPVSVSLSGFNYCSKEHKYTASNISGAGCASGGHETNIEYLRNITNYEIKGKEYVTQAPWMLVIDNATGKAVKLIPSGYEISYTVHEQEKLNSVVYSDKGPERNEKVSNKELERSFELGPVGEKIDDPTVKRSKTWVRDYLARQGVDLPAGIKVNAPSNDQTIKKIPPDILVKSGDGIHRFGGGGQREIKKAVEYGEQVEQMNYSWEMTRKGKKQ